MENNGWIKVSEKLPPEGLEVLTQVADSADEWVDGMWLEVNFYTKGKWFERCSHGPEAIADSGNHVTHWRPLPEPPEALAAPEPSKKRGSK